MSSAQLPSKVFLSLFLATVASAAAVSPIPAAFQSLNTTLNGRLLTGTPWSLPCFTSANVTGGIVNHDAAACTVVQANYLDRTTRLETFGAYQNTQWETCQSAAQQCLLDNDNPNDQTAFSPPAVCQQGNVPPFFVNASSAADVIAAFNFAKQMNIPLSIKNTGHDYNGRSSGAGSLNIWMRGFNQISLNKSFVPQGCSSSNAQPAATIGASLAWNDVYAFADANGITLPGGADFTVGAVGGYLQGGGHGVLSNAYGLAVDRVLEFEVVTPNGQHLFANKCQNSDLFFALRGGGGGTFGVVLGMTTLALPKVTIPTIFASIPPVRSIQKQFLSFMANHTLEYMQQGWAGYLNPEANLIFANPLLNASAAEKSLQQLKTFVTQTLGGNFTVTIEPSYLSFYNDFLRNNEVPIGLPIALASRLVPKDNFATAASRSALVDAVMPALDEVPLPLIFLVSPIVYGNRGGTSVTPAWYTSPWHVTASNTWNYNTTTAERRQIYQELTDSFEPIRNLTPNGGAYLNEADTYEPDWQNSFWGSNYNQLLQIKNKYDPNHLLDCWRCVGWLGESASRYSCYDKF